ncbi:hypothetical protein GCM10027058_08540 [Microbacterium neimengense]
MKDYLTAPGALLVGVIIGLVVFGVMPVLAAKLMSLAFPKDDPRRPEMAAEVYSVPRWERPVWVGEQVGRIFIEAVPARMSLRFRFVRRLPDQRLETQRWELRGAGGEDDPWNHVSAGQIAFIKYQYGTQQWFKISVEKVTRTRIYGVVLDPDERTDLRAGAKVKVPVHALGFATTQTELDEIDAWLRSHRPPP